VRLINDILDIERIESGEIPMHLEEVESAEVLADVADAMDATAVEAAVDLVLDAEPALVFADADHLVQALTNLVANAIKFSHEGGRVWLSTRAEGPDAVFGVRDEGRGIPVDKVDLIFERFAQVDTTDSRQRGGTGLGLAITRSIVERHGGRVWVDSEVGKGSSFFFSIPLLPHTRPRPALEDEGEQVRSVLLCDDDASARELVGELLRGQGYQVMTAATGEEAIDLARRHRPEAILMDLMLPGMSGWETAASLRRDPATAEVPIIITSILAPGDVAAPVETDVDAWITKPLDEAALLAALQRSLDDEERPARVLIVEDDADLARVIATTFERHGLQTFHATTGSEAISLSQDLAPDLLILDLVLPEGNGFEVVDWLRSSERLSSMPLVVYTVRDLNDAERARLRLGQTVFLTKARVAPERFEQRVMALLDRILPRASTNGRETRERLSG
jgi:CheY-like chemotaxis protein